MSPNDMRSRSGMSEDRERTSSRHQTDEQPYTTQDTNCSQSERTRIDKDTTLVNLAFSFKLTYQTMLRMMTGGGDGQHVVPHDDPRGRTSSGRSTSGTLFRSSAAYTQSQIRSIRSLQALYICARQTSHT